MFLGVAGATGAMGPPGPPGNSTHSQSPNAGNKQFYSCTTFNERIRRP
jgi:hypothetical protein